MSSSTTRFLRVAFLFVLLLLLAWLGAIVLLRTSPSWLARSRFGEQAYGVLIVLASTGLQALPVLAPAAVLLGATWLWRRREDVRRAV